jgi:hypothetical protein
MGSHRSVAISSLHTSSLPPPPPPEYPPHTTRPGRVLRNSLAPTRAALHTRISRHAPTRPRCAATRPHTSGRPVARSTAQLASSWAASVVMVVAMVWLCVLVVLVCGWEAPEEVDKLLSLPRRKKKNNSEDLSLTSEKTVTS